ncbi:MAG: hypothetical protein V7K35_08700 [Nostoc sp.]|uniref:hypothetical protein n=1 Tax=Nostoc sp. TaxID=1180 RepID=UPI002FF584C3
MELVPSLQTGNKVTQAFRFFLVPFQAEFINEIFGVIAEKCERDWVVYHLKISATQSIKAEDCPLIEQEYVELRL